MRPQVSIIIDIVIEFEPIVEYIVKPILQSIQNVLSSLHDTMVLLDPVSIGEPMINKCDFLFSFLGLGVGWGYFHTMP